MPVSKNKIQLPTMTPGTTRSIAWLRYGKTGARPKVYIQAAIHANELPGAMLLHHLMPMLAEADRAGRIKGEVIVVPTVNPIGQSQLVGNNHLGRYDLLSRDNFNRNWLDLSEAVAERVGPKLGDDAAANVDLIRKAAIAALKAMQPLNELQTMRVEVMKLSIDADIVLDLHCDMEAALHLFVSKRDLTGAAQELAADLGVVSTMYNEPYAEALTFSGVNGALWARLAERFPAAAIPQACFSSTVELRSQHDVNHALGESDARNLYRYLVRRGVISGRAGPLPRLKSAPTPISGMDVGYCAAPRLPGLSRRRGREGEKGRRDLRNHRSRRSARTQGANPDAGAHRRHPVLAQTERRAGVAGDGGVPHRRRQAARTSEGDERAGRLTRPPRARLLRPGAPPAHNPPRRHHERPEPADNQDYPQKAQRPGSQKIEDAGIAGQRIAHESVIETERDVDRADQRDVGETRDAGAPPVVPVRTKPQHRQDHRWRRP